MTPKRTADTMSDAIALSSPCGRMSKRARKAANERLGLALFGTGNSIFGPEELTEQQVKADKARSLLRSANNLRSLASKGMSTTKFNKAAKRLEEEAAQLLTDSLAP